MFDLDVLQGATALVAVSDGTARHRHREWLTSAGMTVIDGFSGADAVRLAGLRPDLVLLDSALPDISGLEVAAMLKADPLTQSIPVIQWSASPIDDTAWVEGLAAGADSYLVEPTSRDMLVVTVATMLRQRDLNRQLELALSLDVTGIFDWSTRSGQVRWSESLERLHRMTPGTFGGSLEDFEETVHPDDLARVRAELDGILDTADTFELAFRFRRADGTFGELEGIGRVFRDADGQAVRVLGLAHDVTQRVFERRRVEQLRRLAGELNRARTSSRVLGIVRDELDGFGASIDLVDRDAPPSAEVTFSYVASGARLDLVLDRSHERGLTRRQAVAIGELAGGAVERALSYEAERTNAIAMQRALLPASLPEVGGWVIDAEYEPASEEERLGGDFYDVVELDGAFVVMVGDVAGHGLAATRQMGTVRTLLRTMVVSHDGDPATVLAEARRLFDRVCGGESPFVTTVLARVSLSEATMTLSSAGHPPPIVHRGGRAALLDVVPGLPLGVSGRGERGDGATELALGDVSWVALYTDGVFEGRNATIDERIESAVSMIGADIGAADLMASGDRVDLNPDDRAVVVIRRA